MPPPKKRSPVPANLDWSLNLFICGLKPQIRHSPVARTRTGQRGGKLKITDREVT